MRVQFALLLVVSLWSGLAAADTIYKYRRADGRTVYTNSPLAEGVLLETFEYRFPAPPPAQTESERERRRLEAEDRIRRYLVALEQAWQELEDARRNLAHAEERLRSGVEPHEDEPGQLVRPVTPVVPPAAGGPQPPAKPPAGGPQPPAQPAAGGPGPLAKRQSGGGRSPEYAARMAALEADVAAARERLEAAERRYTALR